MSKLFNRRLYIVVIILLVCLGITFLVRSCLVDKDIAASVSPLDVEIGTPIFYSDSTRNNDSWSWEFGNGDFSDKKRGSYTYPETGRYQIRLTIENGEEKKFIVNIRPKKVEADLGELISIDAPKMGIQGEYIIFKGEGKAREWRWEFGETGMVDAREQTAIYRYEQPGIYEVLLTTENTQYPVRHMIDIAPQYTENDAADVTTLIGNDIKEKLQAIIDQKPFNKNYNYILDTYLCDKANTLVIINNNKRNDFYSYCQGLKIIGRNKTVIENVLIDIDPQSPSCIQKLIILQTDIN